jgi:hypothetical protein
MLGAAGISHWISPSVSTYGATVADNGSVISSGASPLSYLAVTLPPTTAISMGWMIAVATDGNKAASVQVNGGAGGHILYPGSSTTKTSASLANGNYEFLALQFDGANFRVVQATPATAALIGTTGSGAGINRWSFPAVDSYAASQSDNGNTVSSYNTPGNGLRVILPSTSLINAGWMMGFATDNGKTMTIQTNGTQGGQILYPAGADGTSSGSVMLAAANHEFLILQFDGSGFRVLSATPRTTSALGMLGHQIMTGSAPRVGSGPGDCGAAPTIAGNDSVGRITVGGAANGGQCTITFWSSWPSPPICSAFDETSASLIRPTGASTTGVVLMGMLAPGDSVAYHCVGYQ